MIYLLKGGPGSGRKPWKNKYAESIKTMQSQNYTISATISEGIGEDGLAKQSSSVVLKVIGENGKTYYAKPVNKMWYKHKQDDFHKSNNNGLDYHCAASDINQSFKSTNVPISASVTLGVEEFLFSEEVPNPKKLALFIKSKINYESLEKTAIIDSLVGQTDGHNNNYIINENDEIVGIDYNLAGANAHYSQFKSQPIELLSDKLYDIKTSQTDKYDEYVTKKRAENTGKMFYRPHPIPISKKTLKTLPKKLTHLSNTNKELQAKLDQRYKNFLKQASDLSNDFGDYVLIEYDRLLEDL